MIPDETFFQGSTVTSKCVHDEDSTDLHTLKIKCVVTVFHLGGKD